MADFNHIILTGRLTKDPVLQTTTSGTVIATFTLANEPYWTSDESKKRTNFIICKSFGKQAEFVQNNLHSGQHIGIAGSLSLTSRKNDDGSYDNFTNVMVNEIKLLPGSFDKKNGNGQAPAEDEDTSFYGPEDGGYQAPKQAQRKVPGRR